MPKPGRKMQKANAAAQAAVLPKIPEELLDQLVKGPMTPEAVQDASQAFKKALIERALGAEMSHHLGYAAGSEKPQTATNQRNGKSGKTVLTDDGPLRIEVPRDREGNFEPKLIGKHERRFTGFDDKIIAMYARGMTVREIQGFLSQMYATDVTPEFISNVTDAILAEVGAWQSRPLEPMYPVIFFDALRVKIREDNVVRNKAVYLALGVRRDGTRDILGLWIDNTEGAAAQVLSGAAELGFVEGEVDEPALAHWEVGRDPMVLVGRRDAERVDEDWLRAARWIVREQGSGTRSTFEDVLRTRGFDPAQLTVAMTLPSNEAVRTAVEAGAGVAVLSRLVVATSNCTLTFDLVLNPCRGTVRRDPFAVQSAAECRCRRDRADGSGLRDRRGVLPRFPGVRYTGRRQS